VKNLLIIGGSYFLGRVFVEEVLERGEYAPYVLNRGNIPLRKEGAREIVCDRHDEAGLRRLVPDLEWEAVVDFCAYVPGDVAVTVSVLAERKPAQYIYVSTASVYEKTLTIPVTEDAVKLSGPQPELGAFADYAYNKWMTEVELERRCGEVSIAFTNIRPAFIYGKYNYAPRERWFFDKILRNETIFLPEGYGALFSMVSVWDTARIIHGCIGNKKAMNDSFNGSAEELISYGRLAEVLEEVSGKKLEIEYIPVHEIIERRIPLPFPLDEHLVYSGEKVKTVMDFAYTAFLDGMSLTYRYYPKDVK